MSDSTRVHAPGADLSGAAGTSGTAARKILRRWLGFGICALGAAVLLADLLGLPGWFEAVTFNDPRLRGAVLGGLMAALMTTLGAVPVLLSQQYSQRTCDVMMGFGAGVMLAACSFSLILPALAQARSLDLGAWGSCLLVGGGIIAGALLLMLIDRWVPHEHFLKGREGLQADSVRRVWLFVLAIALHNLPEGLAIGVAFGGADIVAATALATGISIQDIPEGLVIALALRGVGYSRGFSFGLSALSGFTELIASVGGFLIVSISAWLLPVGLACAAGAMLFVISHEVIPESHRKGHEKLATIGLMLGFVLMMMLDTAMG